jgi:hypothetical protein
MVLPLTDKDAAAGIRRVVDRELRRLYSGDSIWAQDHRIYHATVYHASSHTVGRRRRQRPGAARLQLRAAPGPATGAPVRRCARAAAAGARVTAAPLPLPQMPVKASRQQVDKEESIIRAVASQFCPIEAVLDRVVATSSGGRRPQGGEPGGWQRRVPSSSLLRPAAMRVGAPPRRPPAGVVVATWQVLASGGEPAVLRQALGAALPNAPPKEGQMVTQPAILHTTVARLLAPLKSPGGAVVEADGRQLEQAAGRMTTELCGLRTKFDALWFVEEKDTLALALRGSYDVHPCPLQCGSL